MKFTEKCTGYTYCLQAAQLVNPSTNTVRDISIVN